MLLTSQSWEVMAKKAVVRVWGPQRSFWPLMPTSISDHHMDQQAVCYLLLPGQNCSLQPPQGQGAMCSPPSSMDTEPDTHQGVHSSWCTKGQNSILYTEQHALV